MQWQHNGGAMTNAELRTIREKLGLSVAWCALHLGNGVSKRAWNYWESGRKDITVRVPHDVASVTIDLAEAVLVVLQKHARRKELKQQ